MSWTLYIVLMTASLSITSSTIHFESRELCQQTQQALAQQLAHFNPPPQYQMMCTLTTKGEKT